MVTTVIHKINAILCGAEGLFALFLAFSVGRLVASPDVDLPPDALALVPSLMAFCIFYGMVSLFYAYCRFCWGREKNRVLVFFRKWPVYLLALAAHGLSLVWIVPVLFGMTDLRGWFAFPLGFVALLNVIVDAAPYLKTLGVWVMDALTTKIGDRD